MSITQKYWLVWSPGLILAGFFLGIPGLLALFMPSYLAYYGHHKDWSIGRFALAATGVMLALFFLATSRPM